MVLLIIYEKIIMYQ